MKVLASFWLVFFYHISSTFLFGIFCESSCLFLAGIFLSHFWPVSVWFIFYHSLVSSCLLYFYHSFSPFPTFLASFWIVLFYHSFVLCLTDAFLSQFWTLPQFRPLSDCYFSVTLFNSTTVWLMFFCHTFGHCYGFFYCLTDVFLSHFWPLFRWLFARTALSFFVKKKKEDFLSSKCWTLSKWCTSCTDLVCPR